MRVEKSKLTFTSPQNILITNIQNTNTVLVIFINSKI